MSVKSIAQGLVHSKQMLAPTDALLLFYHKFTQWHRSDLEMSKGA